MIKSRSNFPSAHIGVRGEFRSGGGGGGLKSLSRIFVSIACTKIKWFCPNITGFLFASKMAILKNSKGGVGAAASWAVRLWVHTVQSVGIRHYKWTFIDYASPKAFQTCFPSLIRMIVTGGGVLAQCKAYGGVPLYNRSLFWEKSLNIGYGFELENLKHTPHFCNFAVDTRYFRPFRR